MTSKAQRQINPGTRRTAAPLLICYLLFAICHFAAAPAVAQVLMPEPPEELEGIDLQQKPGAQVPLDLTFTDSRGTAAALSSYFNQGKPVVLSLVYYDCPMLCPLTLEKLQERLNNVSYDLGGDFTTLVVSFDHTNTTAQAAGNKQVYLSGYKHHGDNDKGRAATAGWEFFTSDASSVRLLANAVGFPYKFIPESGEYAHGSALIVFTPEGKVSRYLDGLGTDGQELRLALLEASEGKIAKGLVDLIFHRCFRWNPATNAYSLQAFRVMQIGAILTAAGIGTLLLGLKAGERARAYHRAQREAQDNSAHNAPHAPHALGSTP